MKRYTKNGNFALILVFLEIFYTSQHILSVQFATHETHKKRENNVEILLIYEHKRPKNSLWVLIISYVFKNSALKRKISRVKNCTTLCVLWSIFQKNFGNNMWTTNHCVFFLLDPWFNLTIFCVLACIALRRVWNIFGFHTVFVVRYCCHLVVVKHRTTVIPAEKLQYWIIYRLLWLGYITIAFVNDIKK